MNYISHKFCKLFNLEYIMSMLKCGLCTKKIITTLSVIVASYIVLFSTCNLFKNIFFTPNIKETKIKETNITSNRIYRKITSDSCSGCASKSQKTSETPKKCKKHKINKINKISTKNEYSVNQQMNKKKIKKSLRKIKID